MTSKVNGKTGTLTPCRSETPENFITKIGHNDYVAGGNTHAKLYVNRPRGVRPTNSQNITSCDFVYFPSPFLSFFLVVAYSNKKAVLSQIWPRDALYISRSWSVAEIWPFKIIQNGGGRHLEFIRIENSTIRSAVHENPTLEPNMNGSDHPLQRYGHSRMLGAYGTPILGGRGGRRGSAMAPLVHCDRCAICNSAAICDRMSPTLKSTGGGSLWAQI